VRISHKIQFLMQNKNEEAANRSHAFYPRPPTCVEKQRLTQTHN